MKITIKKYLLTLSLIMVTVLSVSAQTQTVSAAISSSVNATVTGTPILAAFSTEADIEFGLITDAVSFAVKSNRLWKLTTSITGITSAVIGGGPAAIDFPLQPLNISWGVIDGAAGTVTSFTAFANATTTTAADVQVKTGPRGAEVVGGNTFTLRFKVIPGFLVDPGTYGVTVVHTLSAQ